MNDTPRVGERVRVVIEGVVAGWEGGIEEPRVLLLRTDQGFHDTDARFHSRVPYHFADFQPVAEQATDDSRRRCPSVDNFHHCELLAGHLVEHRLTITWTDPEVDDSGPCCDATWDERGMRWQHKDSCRRAAQAKAEAIKQRGASGAAPTSPHEG